MVLSITNSNEIKFAKQAAMFKAGEGKLYTNIVLILIKKLIN